MEDESKEQRKRSHISWGDMVLGVMVVLVLVGVIYEKNVETAEANQAEYEALKVIDEVGVNPGRYTEYISQGIQIQEEELEGLAAYTKEIEEELQKVREEIERQKGRGDKDGSEELQAREREIAKEKARLEREYAELEKQKAEVEDKNEELDRESAGGVETGVPEEEESEEESESEPSDEGEEKEEQEEDEKAESEEEDVGEGEDGTKVDGPSEVKEEKKK